jgi:hypothetical protein
MTHLLCYHHTHVRKSFGCKVVGLRSGGTTPTPLINKERGIKVGFICLRLHHPTLSSVVLPKHPTKRTQLQRIPQIWQRERLSLFRWTWEIFFLYRSHFHSNHSLFTPLQPALQSWNCRWARTGPLSRGALKSWNCPWART